MNTNRVRMAFRALRHRNFRYFWLSGVGSFTAQGMQQFMLVWLVLQITGSLAQLGLVVFVQGLTMLSSVMFGGVLADRMDRRKILGGGQALLAAAILILALVETSGSVRLWHLYLVSGLTGLVQGFTQPARASFVGRLVAREDIMNGVALNSMLQNASRILGPGLAGGVIEVVGIGSALFLNAGFYLFGILGLFLIRGVPVVARGTRSSAVRDLGEGLRYARNTPLVLAVVLMAMSLGLFGMVYIQLAPAFVKDVLGLGAGEAGLMLAAAGIGSLVGNIGLASLGNYAHRNRLMIGFPLLFAASLLVFAISPWLALSVAAMLFVGMGSASFFSVANATIQLTTPPELVGRVMSILLLTASLMFIGTLPMGLLGEWLGLRAALSIGAVAVMGTTLMLGVAWSPIRRASTPVSVEPG